MFETASNTIFILGLAFILTHELDAMRCREWRIFPGLSSLDDRTGELAFLALHVPLFALILWFIWPNGALDEGFAFGFDVFLVLHLLAHIALRRHPSNQFTDAWSWSFIIGGAVCGGVHAFML